VSTWLSGSAAFVSDESSTAYSDYISDWWWAVAKNVIKQQQQ